MVSRRLIALALTLAAAPALAASLDSAIGEKLFQRNWVSAPSSTKANDGLGPFYDAPSCAACHTQKPSATTDERVIPMGTVVRLGNGSGEGDPVYGVQLQTRAVPGLTPEAAPVLQWSDGEHKPAVMPVGLAYGPLAAGTRVGLRRAPSLKGIGLLARVPDSEILKREDTEDADRDGIVGRAAWLYVNGKRVLGRFGWRATQPDLASQVAAAFSHDIGLSTRLDPDSWGDCTKAEHACLAAPSGAERGAPEVADEILDSVTAYVSDIPAPPAAKPSAGGRFFDAIGCAACHATLHLANGTPVPAYTDLLLHNMGQGLADGMTEGAADAWFWRTAPLWDVAESLKLGGLLHDGRARSVAEAVEWHDGEAAAARARFRALTPADRAALVAFVSGL